MTEWILISAAINSIQNRARAARQVCEDSSIFLNECYQCV